MNFDRPDSTLESATPTELVRSPRHFWVWLSLALSLYALVMLSPELAQQEQVLQQSRDSQLQLRADRQRLQRLERVLQSIQSEPVLTQRLLNEPQSLNRGERDILAQRDSTYLSTADPQALSDAGESIRSPHWYSGTVTLIGQRQEVRLLLMGVVIVTLLVTFSTAQPANQDSTFAEGLNAGELPRRPAFFSHFVKRYAEQDAESAVDLDWDFLGDDVSDLDAQGDREDEWQQSLLAADDISSADFSLEADFQSDDQLDDSEDSREESPLDSFPESYKIQDF